MITIHYDFTDGSEISYGEGIKRIDNFNTNCLQFFSAQSIASDVVILRKDGAYISRNELLQNVEGYTQRHIRPEHNILKMFIAGAFSWKYLEER